MAKDLASTRAAYAHEAVTRFGGHDRRLEAAFARVPREAFLGPPPWLIFGEGMAPARRTSNPRDLYHDVLVALDVPRGINNGQPSLHAACLEALRLGRDDVALHIGAGTGYYTAVLAELVARVEAYEIETDLAARALNYLAPWPNVTVHAESAAGHALPDADVIYVSAGASQTDPFWLDALREGGRLLFPLTVEEGWGAMLLVERRGTGFAARFLMRCSFIGCVGEQDSVASAHLRAAFESGGLEDVRSLTRTPPSEASVWFAGDGWYLSTEPPRP